MHTEHRSTGERAEKEAYCGLEIAGDEAVGRAGGTWIAGAPAAQLYDWTTMPRISPRNHLNSCFPPSDQAIIYM